MKKLYILIGSFIFLIIIISVVGAMLVTGDKEINMEKDILLVQENEEKYFTGYGYDIDNPNIIIDPYGNSPLTAMVMFETDDYVNVDVSIRSKDGMSDINYTFDKCKYHVIPIYGLYADYNNTIVLRGDGKEKEINIMTDSLPSDFVVNDVQSGGNFTFSNSNYPYAIDENGEVRWFLSRKYYGDITFLGDSRIIIGSDKLTEKGQAISFYVMNFLGKVYSEYMLPSSYYGVSTLYNDNVLVLSDKILELDLQTGNIVNEYGNNEDYDFLYSEGDKIIVGKDNNYFALSQGILDSVNYDETLISYGFYDNFNNYKIVKGSRFGRLKETETSGKNVSLFKYESGMPDDVMISADVNRIRITNDTGDDIYLILDKFFGRRVYEVGDIKYINLNGLKGKYTVYFKVKEKIYKTDYYIEV